MSKKEDLAQRLSTGIGTGPVELLDFRTEEGGYPRMCG